MVTQITAQELVKKIEKTRKKLYKVVNRTNSLTDKEVLKVSVELDLLIMQWYEAKNFIE